MLFVFSLLTLNAFACANIDTDLVLQSNSLLPEASDVTKVGSNFFIVGDDTCDVTRLTIGADSVDAVVLQTTSGCSGKSDFEALFQLPGDSNDADPTLVICEEDGQRCSPWKSGVFLSQWSMVDGGEGCHDDVNWGDNKGVEGAHGFTSLNGDTKMLALIEGDGKLITYKLVNDQWVSESCTYVPVQFDDYSGLSILGSTMAVVSQSSKKMFVTTISGLGEQNFSMGDSAVYDFHDDFEGVEGIYLENVEPGRIAGIIASDDQGSGNFANAVHSFSIECSTTTPEPESTMVESTDLKSYYIAANGFCDVSSEFIVDQSDCASAGLNFGFTEVSVQITASGDSPLGCFVENGALWFNVNDDAKMDYELLDRLSVCKGENSPSKAPALATSTTTFDPTVEYYLSATSHCDERSEFISKSSECELASQYLGLLDQTVESIENEDRPFGCFYKESSSSNQLWLNRDNEAEKNLNDSQRRSVCKRPVTLSPTVSPPTSLPVVASTSIPPIVAPTKSPITSIPTQSMSPIVSPPSISPTSARPSSNPTSNPAAVTTTQIEITTEEQSTTPEPIQYEYYASETGHCASRSEFIDNSEECDLAALSLALSDVSSQAIENEDRPYGCFFKATAEENQLWFNRDSEASKSLVDSQRQSICKRVVDGTTLETETTSVTETTLGNTLSDGRSNAHAMSVVGLSLIFVFLF